MRSAIESKKSGRGVVRTWSRYGRPPLQCARCYVGVTAALVLAYYLDTVLISTVRTGPFSAFYCVVLFATWCGGLVVGLIATLASAVIVWTQFIHGLPPHEVIIEPHALLITFIVVATVLCVVVAYAQIKRKAAEETGSLARVVVETASDAIFVKDARGKYLLINEAGARFVAKAVQDIIGQDDARLLSRNDAQRVKALDREIMTSGQARTIEETVVLEGRERVFFSTKIPYRDRHGDVVGLVGISREITEQKQEDRASRLLNEATALLGSSLEYSATMAAVARSAVPTLGDGCSVHIVDEETGALRMLAAYHPDAAKVAAAWELERKYPARSDAVRGAAAVVRTGEPELIAEVDDPALSTFALDRQHMEVLRSFGIRSLLCIPMVARSRTLGAMTFAMVDSGRKYRPEDVPLATEIARRAAIAIDHARMYELTRQAVAVREDFLSIASHELRTPLTSLQIGVQRLLRHAGTDGGLGSSSASMLATVDRSTRRLGQLVDDLLDISRLMSQKTAFEYEDVDAVEVVREVLAESSDTLNKAGCSVTVTTDGDAHGRWNHERLRLTVTNLLSNAAKYGPGRPIEVAVLGDTMAVQIRVTDHGIGIAPEVQSRIFERFERAVSERQYGGFGLGLWIVKQIVSAFGGKVEVASELGSGATFIVTLPREPPRAEADSEAEPLAGRQDVDTHAGTGAI